MPIDGATIRLLRVKFLEYGPAVKPSRSCPGGKPAMRAAVKIVVSHGRDSSQGWFRKAVRAAFPDAKISHHGSTTELVIRMAVGDFAMVSIRSSAISG